ncbi:copper homeostasis protein CutC [Flavimaricola marinus]|uniref:PF03932 family protein CutC n=1 Tax=Flavimaricola marinus TaxID=1819565 RepID=A0A238LCL0_9RHOB|nr:copper homeostasis protein CutC [Flavimaricola marinus]SMY06660.1 Copper homeostasis protein CutC [Flavimaricola marinus]
MAALTLEVCIDSAAGLAVCAAERVDRVELCSALDIGGLTPSPGLMALAGQAGVPAHAMIRPRSGDFCYDDGDVAQMLADIEAARRAGLAGVVVGATGNGGLDTRLLARLIAQAEGMETTLHRAIDTLPDQVAAVEQAIALGFDRILTSGGAATAPEGRETIAAMQATARGRITIMAGSGVTPDAVPDLLRTGIRDLHASCAAGQPNDPAAVALGFGGALRRDTDAAKVRALRAALDAAQHAAQDRSSSI